MNNNSADSRIVHVDKNGIDGHPYNVTKCTKQSDRSIIIDFQFTEDLESYARDREEQSDSTSEFDDLIFNLN